MVNETSLVGACSFFCGLDLSEAKDHDVQVTYYKIKGVDFDQWPSAYAEYLIQDVEHLHTLYSAQDAIGTVRLLETLEDINIFKEAPRRAAFHYALTLASAWGLRVDGDAVAELRTKAEDDVRRVADAMVSQGFATELRGKPRERKDQVSSRFESIPQIRERVREAYESQGRKVPLTDTDRKHCVAS